MRRFGACLAAGLAMAIAFTAQAQENILILVADNLGPELIGTYAESNDPAPTPNLDALATNGVLFRNATSNPFGGPTRATMLTGRYSFRTNVGALKPPTKAPAWTKLDLSEITLPEMLAAAGAGYRSAALGEWNIGPLSQGFEYYAGAPDNLSPNYRDFFKTRLFSNGTSDEVRVTCDANNTDPVAGDPAAVRAEPCYETTNLVDEAILKIQEFETSGSPWLVWVGFHAVRSPLHRPPDELLPSGRRYNWKKDSDKLRAMLEAMDTEIGRLLADLPAGTTVIFVSDNAGENEVGGCTDALGTCIRVPLIVSRPGSAVGESTALVNTTDVFATVAEIAGVTSEAEDSVSLLPHLIDPNAGTQHRPSAGGPYTYAEHFHFGVGSFGRTIRNENYKYVWTFSGASGPWEELYDLAADPGQLTNRLDVDGNGVPNPPQGGAEQAAHQALAFAIFETLHDADRDLVPYQSDNCPEVPNRLIGACDTDGDGIGNACDCDFNNDGACGAPDFGELTAQLGSSTPTDLDPDMNCDGSVDLDDYDIFEPMFNQEPGPSGVYCADPLRTSGSCWPPVIPDSGVSIRENILLIVLDDVPRSWVDRANASSPPTPTIDSISEAGVAFSSVYGSSTCSPTRATILTGQYALRNRVLDPSGGIPESLDPAILPRALSPAYRTAGVGKIHSLSYDDLINRGFESFAGKTDNIDASCTRFSCLMESYYDWTRFDVRPDGIDVERITCPNPDPTDPSFDYEGCYATSVAVNDAIAKIQEFEAAGEPWFVWLGPNAVHAPLHVPPYALLTDATISQGFDTDTLKERAMLEALDTELQRLMQVVPEDTIVIIVGDNGSQKQRIVEGGVRVPLVVKRRGMAAAGSVSSAFVNTTDLYDTLMEIADIPLDAGDSESLIPLLEDPSLPTQPREATGGPYVYTGILTPNFDTRAIRSDQYKYVWSAPGKEELYDFNGDGQAVNLLDLDGNGVPNPPPDPASQAAYDALVAAMTQVQDADADGVDYLSDNCTGVANSGALSCDVDGDNIGNICDCDFNNDQRCDNTDYGILYQSLGFTGIHAADMNCDGQVNDQDAALFLPMQGGNPGPSGTFGALPGSMTCGNGALEVWEGCDGDDFRGATCGDLGCTGGNLTCTDNCIVDDTSCAGCGICGDGVIDPGESCDREDFGSLTCADLGCTGGWLSCSRWCTVESFSCSGCSVCDNDGVCESGEDCSSCPNDCISGGGAASCGDGVCDAWAGEDCVSCALDCNGRQNGPASRQFCCGDSSQAGTVPCSDSRCTENGLVCNEGQAGYCCGDGVCGGIEDSSSCELDCGPPPVSGCGNLVCESGEDCTSCPGDCEGKTNGPASKQFCCGNLVLEGPEGDGTRCDGNF